MKKTITTSEIFGPTIQGEGPLAGRLTTFVRTGGCDFRCGWCDSLPSVLPMHKDTWRELSPAEVLTRVMRLAPNMYGLVTLSGGNPALQPALPALISLGRSYGYTFAMETQGSKAREWFNELDHLILSPKPPSSGMPFDAEPLAQSINFARRFEVGRTPTQISLKVVVFNEYDYKFARNIHASFAKPNRIPFYLTPGNAQPPSRLVQIEGSKREEENERGFSADEIARRTEWLIERCAKDGFTDGIHIVPQIHTLLWGNKQRV